MSARLRQYHLRQGPYMRGRSQRRTPKAKPEPWQTEPDWTAFCSEDPWMRIWNTNPDLRPYRNRVDRVLKRRAVELSDFPRLADENPTFIQNLHTCFSQELVGAMEQEEQLELYLEKLEVRRNRAAKKKQGPLADNLDMRHQVANNVHEMYSEFIEERLAVLMALTTFVFTYKQHIRPPPEGLPHFYIAPPVAFPGLPVVSRLVVN